MVKHCWERQEDASDLAGRHELGEPISRHLLVFDSFIYKISLARGSVGLLGRIVQVVERFTGP